MKVVANEPAGDRAYAAYQKCSPLTRERSVSVAGAGSCSRARSNRRSDRTVCFVAALQTHLADAPAIENNLGRERPKQAIRALASQSILIRALKDTSDAMPGLHGDACPGLKILYRLPFSGLRLHV